MDSSLGQVLLAVAGKWGHFSSHVSKFSSSKFFSSKFCLESVQPSSFFGTADLRVCRSGDRPLVHRHTSQWYQSCLLVHRLCTKRVLLLPTVYACKRHQVRIRPSVCLAGQLAGWFKERERESWIAAFASGPLCFLTITPVPFDLVNKALPKGFLL